MFNPVALEIKLVMEEDTEFLFTLNPEKLRILGREGKHPSGHKKMFDLNADSSFDWKEVGQELEVKIKCSDQELKFYINGVDSATASHSNGLPKIKSIHINPTDATRVYSKIRSFSWTISE